MAGFTTFWSDLLNVARSISLIDIIDIIIVACLIYFAIKLVRETRAAQLIKGIAILFLSYFLATQLELKTLSFIMERLFTYGILAIVVLFQPELRRALEQVGRTRIRQFSRFGGREEYHEQMQKAINAIIRACRTLYQSRTGALIVIERETKLGEVIESGTIMNAEPSSEMICNIFATNTPLHDGSLIVRDGMLYAAGCFLPLSENVEISKSLGTRHRAALGISETSDCIVIVVSEETGIISVAENGNLKRNFSPETLYDYLDQQILKPLAPDENRKAKFFKGRKI